MRSPRWLRALLTLAVEEPRRDEVVGDFEEMYARRVAERGTAWAVVRSAGEALALSTGFLARRARRRLVGGLVAGSELRLALRLIVRSPLLSLTVVLALTTGVMLATTGFTVTAAFLGQELPFDEGARVVDVDVVDARSGDRTLLPVALARAWADADVRLDRLGAAVTTDLNLTHGSGEVELITVLGLTPGAFDYVPFQPLAGRFLADDDGGASAGAAVVLGEALWRGRFGADPSIIGQAVDLSGVTHRVVGVVPDVGFPMAAQAYRALSLVDEASARDVAGARLVGLLPPEGQVEQVEGALNGIAAADAGAGYAGPEVRARVRRVEDPPVVGGVGGLVVALLLGLLVVIAGNVGNLMMARAFARRGELNVRAALGADRVRLVSQLTIEALALAVASAVAGLMISQRLLLWFARSEEEIPPWIDLGLDVTTVAFVVLVTLMIAVLAGVLPALRATRVRGEGLRSSATSIAGVKFGWLHDVMIVAQIALAVGVLGAAASINRGWVRGFDETALGPGAESTLVAAIRLPAGVDDPGTLRRALVTELVGLGGVEAVSSANHTPGVDAPLRRVVVEGVPGGAAGLQVPVARIDDGFFEVIEARPLVGRLMRAEDFGPGAARVALVNEAFVNDRLGGANAIGRRIRIAGSADEVPVWHEIVGVVPDLGLSGLDPTRAGGLYLAMEAPPTFDLLIRADDPSPAFVQQVQAAVYRVHPEVAVEHVSVLAEVVRDVRRIFTGIGSTFTLLGSIVLGLSLLGIYSILAFEVTRRTREIGVRVALGAQRLDVVRPVLGRVARLVAVGGVVGMMLGLALGRLAAGTFMLRVPETGLATLAVLVVIVLAAALAASAVPTLRALAIQPAGALRAE